MKRPSRRTRLSDTTMLKNGRPLEPPRESRMTTMIYPWVVRRTQKRPVHSVLSALRHATWPPGQRHAEKPTIIARSYFFYARPIGNCCMTNIRPSRDQDIAAITAIYAHH